MAGHLEPFLAEGERDQLGQYDDAYENEDDDGDGARLLPDSDLLVEQIRNELGSELIGADLYTRTSSIQAIAMKLQLK
jgi:hypothetical protein